MSYKSTLQLFFDQAIEDLNEPNIFKTETFWIGSFYLLAAVVLIGVITVALIF